MMNRGLLLALAALAAAVPGQSPTSAAVPDDVSFSLAPSHTLLFGEPRQRVQTVIGAAHLAGLAWSMLDALELRHLNEALLPIHGGEVRLELTLSHAAAGPTAARTRFEDNHGGGKQLVFAADLLLPSANAAGGSGPTPWGDPRNVRLSFATPFPYQGGPLCVEIASRALPGKRLPLWLADGAVPAGLPTDNTLYGQATQGAPQAFRPTMFGLAAPGERFDLDLDGLPPGMPAILVLGLSDRSWLGLPLPLRIHTSAGRGVLLQASLDLALATVAASHAGIPNLGTLPLDPATFGALGYASLRFRFPFDPAVLRTTLFAQWIAMTELEVNGKPQLHLAATAGLQVPVVAGPAHLDIAFLQAESQDPGALLESAAECTLRFCPSMRLTGTR